MILGRLSLHQMKQGPLLAQETTELVRFDFSSGDELEVINTLESILAVLRDRLEKSHPSASPWVDLPAPQPGQVIEIDGIAYVYTEEGWTSLPKGAVVPRQSSPLIMAGGTTYTEEEYGKLLRQRQVDFENELEEDPDPDDERG